ncbi:hypothetical protein V6N12_057036 [Hibiscus sabdariffa]|uniref:Uncharacterized protein n=1 Tax=Hibiscus sabdariffa TaxID=183260 RepID=A0ABR2DCT0_9ROSI
MASFNVFVVLSLHVLLLVSIFATRSLHPLSVPHQAIEDEVKATSPLKKFASLPHHSEQLTKASSLRLRYELCKQIIPFQDDVFDILVGRANDAEEIELLATASVTVDHDRSERHSVPESSSRSGKKTRISVPQGSNIGSESVTPPPQHLATRIYQNLHLRLVVATVAFGTRENVERSWVPVSDPLRPPPCRTIHCSHHRDRRLVLSSATAFTRGLAVQFALDSRWKVRGALPQSSPLFFDVSGRLRH